MRVVPRAEALGCSVFALRARAECPNSRVRRGGLQRPREFGHFLVCVFNRPKGEQRIAQPLRPGKAYGKKVPLKAERAADFGVIPKR